MRARTQGEKIEWIAAVERHLRDALTVDGFATVSFRKFNLGGSEVTVTVSVVAPTAKLNSWSRSGRH